MKFSYPINTPEIDTPLLAWKGGTRETCKALRELGYAGVEPFVRDPEAFDVEAFAADIEAGGMKAVAIGTSPMAAIDGLNLADLDDDTRNATINRLRMVIRMGRILGCPVNLAKVRGLIARDPQQMSLRRDDAIRILLDIAGDYGVPLLLEPLKEGSIDNLCSTAETLAWIRAMNRPNLKILLDSFHMQATDPSPEASLVAARDYLVHVHFSDIKRWVPGKGSIDFLSQMRILKALDYSGFISVEIKQKPDSAAAARESIEYLRQLSIMVG